MYSRNLDPRRSTALPDHYGGSAFRSDGTPTPIPVRREPDTYREPLPLPIPELPSDESAGESVSDGTEREVTVESDEDSKASGNAPFLSRLMHGVFPEIREDDLLLLLLLFLLSREEGNGEALLLLAVLLFGS